MALLSKLIRSVRVKLDDYYPDTPQKQRFPDAYYESFLDTALSRLNADTRLSLTLASIPSKYEFALILLAAIESCDALLTRGFGTEESTEANGSLRRIHTEGLDVEYHPGLSLQAKDINKLKGLLEDQYKDWLDRFGFDITRPDELPAIAVSTVNRESVRVGRAHRNYTIDKGIVQDIDDLDALYESDLVVLSWTPIYDTQFSSYCVQKSEDEETWTSIYSSRDNHDNEFEDDDVSVGETYYYRLLLKSKNGIKKYSNVASVET